MKRTGAGSPRLQRRVAMRVSALRVLDDGRLVGLLTEADGLAAFVTAIGAGEGASPLEVVVIGEGQPANLADVVATLESTGNRILGMLTTTPTGD